MKLIKAIKRASKAFFCGKEQTTIEVLIDSIDNLKGQVSTLNKKLGQVSILNKTIIELKIELENLKQK